MILKKLLEYAVILSGVVLLTSTQPIWCITALVFVLYDVWDYILGYIDFKERMGKTIIQIPKNATEEERAKIINQKIKELMEDE